MYSLLTNKDTGAVLASPDVDENFTVCGRYGYCWPRDALFINSAMLELGFREEVEKFYSVWASKTQLSNGLFEQRYYSNGELAPSWGMQIDETASIVIGISKLPDYKNYIEIIKRATCGLIDFLDSNYISKACYDIWEERKSSHLYSTASIYKALELAREMLKDNSDCNHLVYEIDLLLPNILEGIKETFVKNDRLIRSKNDYVIDISLLGAILDFDVFAPSEVVSKNTVKEIEEKLKSPIGGYYRYENDQYNGGNIWIISTLWLALYYIKLGDKERALELYNWVTEHSDDKGFLAEQIDKETGKPSWIVGLSWSHALYIIVGKKLKGM
jgi:GH15 family glucan-1,4-alpha-glucosidase